MDILTILFGMIFSIWFGWHMREVVARHKMQKLMELVEQMHDDEDELPDNYIRISIEKHEDKFFVYEQETSKFLALASSKEELDNSLRARFPGKMFAVKEENLIEVGFLS
jgi:hypothetical protein